MGIWVIAALFATITLRLSILQNYRFTWTAVVSVDGLWPVKVEFAHVTLICLFSLDAACWARLPPLPKRRKVEGIPET